MKKSLRKLALHKETIRALSRMEITHVIGGQGSVAALAIDETKDRQCPGQAAQQSVGE